MSESVWSGLSSAARLPGQDLKGVPPESQRAAKAARQFEGMLLANWLESVEEGLKSFGGETEEAGDDTMGAIGMQAIAAGIADRGGIGLAKMLLKHLSPSEGPGAADAASGNRVSE